MPKSFFWPGDPGARRPVAVFAMARARERGRPYSRKILIRDDVEVLAEARLARDEERLVQHHAGVRKVGERVGEVRLLQQHQERLERLRRHAERLADAGRVEAAERQRAELRLRLRHRHRLRHRPRRRLLARARRRHRLRLRRHVHPVGRALNAEDLVRQVTGRPLDSTAFLQYLRNKIESLIST